MRLWPKKMTEFKNNFLWGGCEIYEYIIFSVGRVITETEEDRLLTEALHLEWSWRFGVERAAL